MEETVSQISETIRHLDLFAGCGGFSRAIELTTTQIITTQFVEIDPDAQKVLKDHYPHIPIYSDARNYSPSKGEFDLISSGIPCTGTSTAGTRTGLDHEESALFREVLRILWECKPKFSIVEQPLGIVTRGLRAILGGLRMVGYESECQVVSAQELGAGHKRERLFVISYPYGQFGNLPTSWNEQVGDVVTRQRANSQWLTAKRDRLRTHSGFSFQLVSGTSTPVEHTTDWFTCPTHTQGRIRARKLAGRTVTPAQASVAIERILYLNSLL